MADQDAGLVVRYVTVRAVVVPLRRPLATKVGDFSRWPLLLIDVTDVLPPVPGGLRAPAPGHAVISPAKIPPLPGQPCLLVRRLAA